MEINKKNVLWLLHNTVSHPIYGILLFLGFNKTAQRIHDMSLPNQEPTITGMTLHGSPVTGARWGDISGIDANIRNGMDKNPNKKRILK